MPDPRPGSETEQEFIDRFMSSAEAKNDYPDTDQRLAVARSMWESAVNKASDFKQGDKVQWDSAGGKAQGVITRIIRNGEVPGIDGDVKVTGTEEDPAAQIQILDDEGNRTDTTVGHKLSTLNRMEKAKTFKAPEQARQNARKVLQWREEHGDEVAGMTRVGWERANQLADNEDLSLDTVQRMAQFARHEQHKEVAEEHKGEPWKDAGHVAWLGWGGDAGIEWAKRVSEENTEKALRPDQQKGTVSTTMTEVHKTCEVLKADEDQRLVYGWAWVNTLGGELVFDSEEQAIETPELQKAAHQFMSEVRKAGSVHMRDPETGEKVQSGEIVESLVFSPELQKALGIDLGKTGWFIVSKVTDDEQWRKVKKMEHISFSIGGRAETVPYQE